MRIFIFFHRHMTSIFKRERESIWRDKLGHKLWFMHIALFKANLTFWVVNYFRSKMLAFIIVNY